MENFYTIKNEEIEEIVEKKSRFIATIFNVEDIEQAEQKIKEIKKKFHDAKHNCIAYRVLEKGQIIEKSSDDGEPSGTAGAPMLNVLQKNRICNIVVIVTRYFGGVLLGTGGLVRAYTEVTQKAIEKSDLIYKVEGFEVEISIDYPNFEFFKYYCKTNDIKIIEIEYLENINIKIEIEKDRKNILLNDIETKSINIKKILGFKDKYINKTVEKINKW